MRYNLIHSIPPKNSPEKAENTIKKEKKSSQPNFYEQKETKINCVYYIADYIKLVIENGNKFAQENLYPIFDTLIFEELSKEVINTFKIIIKEIKAAEEHFGPEKLTNYIKQKIVGVRKQNKLLEVLEELPEPEN